MLPYAPHLTPVRLRFMGQGASPVEGPTVLPEVNAALRDGAAKLGYVVQALSVGASAYHGYKRNTSVGWAIWWGFMGALFPIITPAIAFGQGFGKKAKKS